jgi:hypothetical protein
MARCTSRTILYCLVVIALILPVSAAARGGGGGGKPDRSTGDVGETTVSVDEYLKCRVKLLDAAWTIGGQKVSALLQCTGDGGIFKKNVAEFSAIKANTAGSGTFSLWTYYTNVMATNCGHVINTNSGAFSKASSDSPASNGDLSFSSTLRTKKGEHCFAITHDHGTSVTGDGPNWDFTRVKGTCPGDLNNARKDVCTYGVVLL